MLEAAKCSLLVVVALFEGVDVSYQQAAADRHVSELDLRPLAVTIVVVRLASSMLGVRNEEEQC